MTEEVSVNEQQFEFIADVSITTETSDIINIKIENIDDLWNFHEYEGSHCPCFELFWCINDASSTSTNKSRNNKTIFLGNVSDDGKFYLKFAQYLSCYNITLTISAFNNNTNEWMKESDPNTITIPSIWSKNDYKIGDIVYFKDNGSYIDNECRIIEVLKDDLLKLKYHKFKTDNDDHDDDDDDDDDDDGFQFEEIITTVHISRLIPNTPNLQYTVFMYDPKEIINNTLTQRNDVLSINIFNSIFNSLHDFIFNESINLYGFDINDGFDMNDEFLIHLEPMKYFVTKNIFDFLYNQQFYYRVNCLIETDHNNGSKLVNVRQYDTQTTIKMIQRNVNNVLIEESYLYDCDLCRTGLSDWSFMYVCNADDAHSHFYCLNCISSIITLNTQLKNLLNDSLNKSLNTDCVDTIIDYLIGTVNFSDLQN